MAGVRVVIDVERPVARWRPLIQWAMAMPHLVYEGLFSIAGAGVGAIAGTAVTVTGRTPAGLVRFQRRAYDERLRAYAYFFLLRTSYPRFTGHDPSVGIEPLEAAPGDLTATYPRWEPIARLARVAPLGLALIPVGLVMDLLYPVWMIAILVNGRWPAGLEAAFVEIEDLVVALLAYVGFASDERPRLFSRPGAAVEQPPVIDLTRERQPDARRARA